ncbi:hypothetical protein [uncultured Sphingomonas sp.]|uniref:hypothetical protein n=1 Tax=uncultured Sphingomonas sp. TaxID=158754 RepID=UPI0035CB0444
MHAALPLALLAFAVPGPTLVVDRIDLAQITIRRRVMVRVPRVEPPRAPTPAPVEWREKKGPSCIPVSELGGAIVTARDRIDLVLRGGKRVRAEFDDDCRGLDFYRGFYLKPAADGMVCAGRDVVRSRSGAKCPVERFRKLVPKLRDY